MFTQEELTQKTGPELVEIFNGLPGVSQIKRFTNRETGVKRILATQSTEEDLTVSVDITKTEVVNKRGRKKSPRGVYNEPLGQQIRSCRKTSGRGRLLALTLDGATWDQLRAELPQWTEDQLHRHLRNQHFYLGYGLKTELGVIKAFSE